MTTYNTGNPIGSTAVKDLYDNAENLDVLSNDKTKESHPDRLGQQRKTWHGMEQDFQQFLINSGYEDIGDYGSGLDITARNQIFWRDGELYRAGAVLELPYTTTGDWGEEEGLFVAVGDAALRQAIADDEDADLGTGMIGHEPGVTAREAIDTLSVGISALTEELPISAAQFPSLSDALNSGNSVISIPGGVYELPGGLVVDNPNLTEIRGNGDTVLDLSNSPDPGILIDGGLTSLPAPTTIDAAGGIYIHFPPEADINPGDVIILWNPDDYSLNQWRYYYRDGFMARVSKVEQTGRVTIYGTIPDFNRSNIQAFKLSNNNPLKITGVTIIPPAGAVGLSIRCRQNVHIDSSVTVLNGGYSGIEIERCFDVSVLLGSMEANHSDAYPLIISNTQNFKISGLSASSTRHAVGLGGANREGSVPTRDGIISNCIFENDGELGVGVADIHGNATGIIYDSCVFNSSAHMSGKNNKYIGCTIYSRSYNRDGVCFYGGELSGGTHEIIDCTLILNGATPTTPFGIIHLNGSLLKTPFSLVIRGLTVFSDTTFSGSNTSLVRYNVGSTTNKTFSFDISGLFIAPSVTLQRLVYLGVGDAAPAQFSPRPIVALEKPKDSARFVEDIINIGTFPVGNLLKVVY